jgi:hypothetical protein
MKFFLEFEKGKSSMKIDLFLNFKIGRSFMKIDKF